jgi:hypothetical protein
MEETGFFFLIKMYIVQCHPLCESYYEVGMGYTYIGCTEIFTNLFRAVDITTVLPPAPTVAQQK